MDVRLYTQVAWRFRWLLVGTLILAVLAAVLSVNKISFAGGSPKLTPRGAQAWQSSSVVLVTQQGFPWGRSVFPILPAPNTKAITPTYADPSRFAGLALLYVQLANGNEFDRLLGKVPGTVQASPVLPTPDASSSEALPLIQFTSTTGSGVTAEALADQAASAFAQFLADKQQAAGIPDNERVVIQPVRTHTPARLVTAPKKTVPILIFMIIAAGGFGLALALENMRPRPHADRSAPGGLPPAVRDPAQADAKPARTA